jgi:hypothetical protein
VVQDRSTGSLGAEGPNARLWRIDEESCQDQWAAWLAESENAMSGSQSLDSVRSFLRECAARAAKLLLIGQELQNADRARLFDIMLWANELFNRSIRPRL